MEELCNGPNESNEVLEDEVDSSESQWSMVSINDHYGPNQDENPVTAMAARATGQSIGKDQRGGDAEDRSTKWSIGNKYKARSAAGVVNPMISNTSECYKTTMKMEEAASNSNTMVEGTIFE